MNSNDKAKPVVRIKIHSKEELEEGLFDTLKGATKKRLDRMKIPIEPLPDDVQTQDEAGDKVAIPIRKYSTQEKEKDPKTGKTQRKKPLISLFSKEGLPNNVVKVILRNLETQLKANNIPFTENSQKRAAKILIEEMLLSENQAGYLDFINQIDDIKTIKQLKDFKKKIERLKKGNKPKKMSKSAMAPALEYFTDPEKDGFKKLKKIEAELATPETKGDKNTADAQAAAAAKKARGDKKTADTQAQAAAAAKKRGLKPEQGTIKISTLNQQLQSINPPVNRQQRIKALNLVQNFLKPYLKMYNLKLSESAIKRFTEAIIEVNNKPSCRIKILK